MILFFYKLLEKPMDCFFFLRLALKKCSSYHLMIPFFYFYNSISYNTATIRQIMLPARNCRSGFHWDLLPVIEQRPGVSDALDIFKVFDDLNDSDTFPSLSFSCVTFSAFPISIIR